MTEPMYYVWIFNNSMQEFECIGAFSDKVPAYELLYEARKQYAADYPNEAFEDLAKVPGAVVQHTFKSFCEALLASRLGKLAEPLQRLSEAIGGDSHIITLTSIPRRPNKEEIEMNLQSLERILSSGRGYQDEWDGRLASLDA